MTEPANLETELLPRIAAAPDLQTLESLRVELLGKTGLDLAAPEVAGLDEPRRAPHPGAGDQRPPRPGRGRHRRAQGGARSREARRRTRRRRARPLPSRAAPADGQRPSHHAGDGRDDRRLRRDGLLPRRGAGHRGRLPQLHRAELPAQAPGAGDARHLLLPPGTGRGAQAAAHPHQPGAGPHHAPGQRARRRRRGSRPARRRRSGSSRPAAPTAATATPRTPRCSTRSRGW